MSATTTEQTREYRFGKQSVYLTRFGQMGVRSYFEVIGGKQTAAALAAKFNAARPVAADEQLALRFGLLGVELASKATPHFGAKHTEQEEAGMYTAMAALEAETVNRPAPVAPISQPATCRHGIPFTATCAICDED